MRSANTSLMAKICAATFAVLLSFLAAATNAQQVRPERTIEEIKVEAVTRAENGQYPCIGQNPDDLRTAFALIKTRDRDEWAAAFIAVGDKWMAEARSREKTDPTKANADYIRAWRVYSFGHWPVPSPPGKQRAFVKAIEAPLAHTKFL